MTTIEGQQLTNKKRAIALTLLSRLRRTERAVRRELNMEQSADAIDTAVLELAAEIMEALDVQTVNDLRMLPVDAQIEGIFHLLRVYEDNDPSGFSVDWHMDKVSPGAVKRLLATPGVNTPTQVVRWFERRYA